MAGSLLTPRRLAADADHPSPGGNTAGHRSAQHSDGGRTKRLTQSRAPSRPSRAAVEITPAGVVVEFHRRAHLPIVLASGLLNKPVHVPWWNGLPLRLTG